jgi:curved DNA-binding protein CbpA
MAAGRDPYTVLGVPHGASEREIHAAYRSAVRRTHPDAGGSSDAFESVQEAYEVLRDPAGRAAWNAQPAHVRERPAPAASRAHQASMEDLLAESARLEEEARKLAGMASRQSSDGQPDDSVGAVLRDAGAQLRDATDEGLRELRRFIRRRL